MPFPGTVRVEASGENVGDEVWSNVFHYRLNPPDTILDAALAQRIAADVREAYVLLVPVWHDECRLTQVVVRDVRVANGPSFEPAFAAVGPGPGVTPLPPQCAACVSWRTSEHSRRGRGRTYLAGIGAGNLDGSGRIDGGSLNVIDAWMTSMIAAPADEAFFLAIASEADQVSRRVITGRCGNVFDTQRRRRDTFDDTLEVVAP